MGRFFDFIRQAIAEERYIVSVHAAVRLRQRRIPAWQIAAATLDGRLLLERPRDLPNPAVEVEVLLADGTAAKAVWSWLAGDGSAKLVTIHLFDR